MEGEGKGSFWWWRMEGEGKDSHAWWPMVGEGKGFFSPLPTFPQAILLRPSFFFPLILRFYFTMVLDHYLCIFSLFLGLYDYVFWCHKSPTHSLPIQFG
jgi:hypothetical protein